MKPGTKGITFFLLTAILWSISGVLVKIINWNPFGIAGIRSGIAAMVLFLFLDKKGNLFTFNHIKIFAIFCFAITVILFVVATKLTTAANAIIIQYTAPIYPAIFGGLILKERTTPLDWISITVVLGGIVLFFLDRLSPGGYLGNVVAFLSGITFGWFYLLMRKMKDKSPIDSAFLGNIMAFIICIPFYFVNTPSLRDLVFLLILGVFQMGISMVLYSRGITYISALDAILISTLEPILNPIWVFIIVGEKPGKWALFGAVIVISSIVIRCTIKKES